jgi:hypothetical protein
MAAGGRRQAGTVGKTGIALEDNRDALFKQVTQVEDQFLYRGFGVSVHRTPFD